MITYENFDVDITYKWSRGHCNSICYLTLPITPVQILWINIVTAITLVIYIAFEPMEETTMEMLSKDFKASITGGYFHFRILYVEGRIRGITAYFINSRKIHESILTHGFFKKIVSIASGVLIVFFWLSTICILFNFSSFLHLHL